MVANDELVLPLTDEVVGATVVVDVVKLPTVKSIQTTTCYYVLKIHDKIPEKKDSRQTS